MGNRVNNMPAFFKILIIICILIVFVLFVLGLPNSKYSATVSKLRAIRTAVKLYYMYNGTLPDNLTSAVKQQFKEKNVLLPDPYTENNQEVKIFDGTGGWIYNPEKLSIALNYKPLWPPWAWKGISIKITKSSLDKIDKDNRN